MVVLLHHVDSQQQFPLSCSHSRNIQIPQFSLCVCTYALIYVCLLSSSNHNVQSPGLQREQTYPFWRKSTLNAHWKDRSWSWGSNILAISWEEKTPWKRPWCWESMKARGEGDDRRWDGWTVSSKRPTWIWPNSGRQWKTGGPNVLWSMGSRRVGHDLTTTQQQQVKSTTRISGLLMTARQLIHVMF